MVVKRNVNYRPPFPYFGGKSAVASTVWRALGDVRNYVEPFFGSGAVLFLRPPFEGVETINDADGFVCNFWRAVKHDVAAVAEHADNPVNECDLHARHLWLIGQRERITDRLCGDPDFFDAKVAGWWCWGLCCWIGGGWCSGKGPWVSRDGVMVKRPHLSDEGSGVNRKRPHLMSNQGVIRKDERLVKYFSCLSNRLQSVRVCCGDWSRVCGPSVTTKHGLTGIFIDPPYADSADRDETLYSVDSLLVAHDAKKWAVEKGDDPEMRIVFAGYEGEHDFPDTWTVHEWETSGGYGTQSDGESRGKVNAKRERLWMSPHCKPLEEKFALFD